MKKRILVLLLMLVLLALIIGVRVLSERKAAEVSAPASQTSEPVPAPVESTPTPEPVVQTPTPEVEQVPADTSAGVGGYTAPEQVVENEPEPNSGVPEPTPEMTIEDEMQVEVEENSAGGLM